jgi:hypothetical protein
VLKGLSWNMLVFELGRVDSKAWQHGDGLWMASCDSQLNRSRCCREDGLYLSSIDW